MTKQTKRKGKFRVGQRVILPEVVGTFAGHPMIQNPRNAGKRGTIIKIEYVFGGVPTPLIRLDGSGRIVAGYECWWKPLTKRETRGPR